jgi:hypothetical protein
MRRNLNVRPLNVAMYHRAQLCPIFPGNAKINVAALETDCLCILFDTTHGVRKLAVV